MACGGDFDSPAGFIDFPPGEGTEYGHSLACDYTIRVAEGKVVLVFSCEEAALEVLMSICLSVIKLKF